MSSAPHSTPERPPEAAGTPAPPAPMKDIGAPEGLGPYSPRSLSRLAQGAHGRGRAPGDVSPSVAGRARRGASPRHGCRRCQRGPSPRASPPSGRPPAAPGAGRPGRRAPPAQTLCARPPAFTGARSHRPHRLTRPLMLSAAGTLQRLRLRRSLPPVLGSVRRPAPLPALAFGPSPLPLPARRCGPGEQEDWGGSGCLGSH